MPLAMKEEGNIPKQVAKNVHTASYYLLYTGSTAYKRIQPLDLDLQATLSYGRLPLAAAAGKLDWRLGKLGNWEVLLAHEYLILQLLPSKATNTLFAGNLV